MKKNSEAPTKGTRTMNATVKEGQSIENRVAEIKLSPTTMNAVTAQAFIKPTAGEIELDEAISVMQEKAKKINDGDLNELESTLTAQVVSLNSIFNTFAIRSADNMSDHIKASEGYMRLALKAQAQCARTIEVLATLKNPPIVFAKQANIAHGHQQVNNDNQSTRAGKIINPSNELLNEANHATLDTRRAAETSEINQEMATVETFDRSKNTSR
jgi:hypothetical protein